MVRNLTPRDVIDRLTDGITSRHADKWGEAMGAHFAIGYALDDRTHYSYAAGRALMRWQFSDPMGQGLRGIEDSYTRRWISKVAERTLIRAGDILDRYETRMVRAGKDY